MTVPSERFTAIERTRSFLYSLIDPKKTPKIPKNIRQTALSLLRHFPNKYDMERAADNCPEIFDKDQTWYLEKFKNE